ncbi:ankyrin [Amylocystis lapponica]|nr:ankyrin [Amylocystis lapponica]
MATPERRTSPLPRRAERAAVLDHRVSLADAVATANERTARLAIDAGADVNALDPAGRTLIARAIAGQSWEDVDVSDASFMLQSRLRILKMLLDHDDISLYAVNAPVRGATPLGLAAWLNLPDVVRILLEESHGMVVVDGVDAHATTPLMYAARDRRLEVVTHLLTHGARPDFRDLNHRSSVQYALRHPRILWLCERALRKHRLQEEMYNNKRNICALPQPYADIHLSITTAHVYDTFHPPTSPYAYATLTTVLTEAILSTDLPTLHSLLFSVPPAFGSGSSSSWIPALVNLPDSRGWSPVHYCVSVEQPCTEVLDALYRAGADMSLYTASGHGTPLHCFAYRARTSGSKAQAITLRSFALHLVHDLRAPLSARDNKKETCIHVAAEHGHSIDVLIALLSCDTSGNVRELRNSRGLTAQDVAKPEFRAAFGMYAEHFRSVSSASVRTIRPSTASQDSVPSVTSLECSLPPNAVSARNRLHDSSDGEYDQSTLPHRILDNLRSVSSALADSDSLNVDACRELLEDTSDMGAELLAHFRTRIHEAADELRDAHGTFNHVTSAMEEFYGEHFTEDRHDGERDGSDHVRRLTTDSGDSEATAVSDPGSVPGCRKWRSMTDLRAAGGGEVPAIPNVSMWSAYVVPRIASDGPSQSTSNPTHRSGNDPALLQASSSEEKGLMKLRKSRTDLRPSGLDGRHPGSHPDPSLSGTAKLKAWLMRKIKHDSPPPVESIDDGDGDDSPEPTILGHNTCRVSQVIIASANKDLSRIDGCMDAADQIIALASHSVSQAERQLSRAILNRKASLECIRLAQFKTRLEDSKASHILDSSCPASSQELVHFPSAVAFPLAESAPPSPTTSLSAHSSVTSMSSTLIEGDEDDMRSLRRLLTRKIGARTDGALTEIDKATTWLCIVKEVARGLRKRTLTS